MTRVGVGIVVWPAAVVAAFDFEGYGCCWWGCGGGGGAAGFGAGGELGVFVAVAVEHALWAG